MFSTKRQPFCLCLNVLNGVADVNIGEWKRDIVM